MENQNPGLVPDPRTPEQKAKDYKHEQLFSSAPLVWTEKTDWKKYSIRNQDGSSSCVGQASAKALEVMTGIIQSAHPIYRKRANFAQEGMWLANAGDILRNHGTTSEALDPSQNMNESQMNSNILVATPEKIGSYIFVDPHNIDAIASQLDSHPVVVCFDLHTGEWQDIPQIIPNSVRYSGHCVCAVDYTLYNGVKCLVIDESWGLATTLGTGGQRLITEAFLAQRCTGAMYFLPPAPPMEKPIHTFNVNMVLGDKNDEVSWLQKCLIHEGLMKPALVTGYFGQITLNAVKAFQLKYKSEILTPVGLTIPSGKALFFTRKKLNDLYSC